MSPLHGIIESIDSLFIANLQHYARVTLLVRFNQTLGYALLHRTNRS